MKFKKAMSISRAGLDADSIITRAQATQLIADEIATRGERPAATRNRVSQRIRYAIRRGTLHEQSPRSFRFGDLVAWARATWPGKFSDWTPSRAVTDTYILSLGMSARPSADCGSDVTAWRQYAAHLEDEIHKTRELPALKVARDQTRAKCQAAGRNGGRGKIREN